MNLLVMVQPSWTQPLSFFLYFVRRMFSSRNGLVVAVHEIPFSNTTMVSLCVCHQNHCDIQPCTVLALIYTAWVCLGGLVGQTTEQATVPAGLTGWGLSPAWVQIQVWKGVFWLDWTRGHAMRLNSLTGIEGLPVSSLNGDRSLHSGLKAPELVTDAGCRWTASLCTWQSGCSPLVLPPSQEVGNSWAPLSLVSCRCRQVRAFSSNTVIFM